MKRTVLTAVGACAVDTILTVPYFPQPDSKLRALSLTKRRGGNCPNTLEVLQQLIHRESQHYDTDARRLDLELVATLPARSSPQVPFILSSFDLLLDSRNSAAATTAWTSASKDRNDVLSSGIGLSHCIYRESNSEPVSSYIIADQSTGSRTIVNHNDLQEMTFEEFQHIANNILGEQSTPGRDRPEQFWFHFEGRIPPTTLQCIQYLRKHVVFRHDSEHVPKPRLYISVELEKPGREGLQLLALEADVIFYSRSWAEGEGYQTASTCLEEQAKILGNHNFADSKAQRLLICTWGEQGSQAIQLPCIEDELRNSVIRRPGHSMPGRQIVDTVGAGDTFIAGMLFALICRTDRAEGCCWSMQQKLDFANELAGTKILQQGFGGLGGQVTSAIQRLDSETHPV